MLSKYALPFPSELWMEYVSLHIDVRAGYVNWGGGAGNGNVSGQNVIKGLQCAYVA